MTKPDTATDQVWKGTDQLRTLLVPLDSLSLDPANARIHPRKNLEAIKGSLRRFGQQKPIVVSPDGVIVAGNGTVESARELGWTHIAGATTNLEAVDRTAFALTDNRTGELAEWDFEAAAVQLEAIGAEGLDLAELGWDEGEVANLLSAEWSPPAAGEDLEGFGHTIGGHRVVFTADQWATVERAVAVIREQADDPGDELAEGRCLELMAADWLAGQ